MPLLSCVPAGAGWSLPCQHTPVKARRGARDLDWQPVLRQEGVYVGERRGERAARGRVFGKHLELLWLQVGLAADPLAQGGNTVTCFQLELAEMTLLHHQFLPLGPL